MTMARSCAVRCEEISIINYSTESPLNAEEMAIVKLNAKRRLAKWQTRGLWATGAFFVNSAMIYIALNSGSLGVYRALLGKCLIPLWIALLLLFVYYVGLWWGAWHALSDLDKRGDGTE